MYEEEAEINQTVWTGTGSLQHVLMELLFLGPELQASLGTETKLSSLVERSFFMRDLQKWLQQ